MNRSGWSSWLWLWLDRASALAVLLAAGAIIWQVFLRPPQPHGKRLEGPGVGSQLTIQGFSWQQSKTTVLVAVHPSCRFCTESAPFYTRLVDVVRNKPGSRFVLLLDESITSEDGLAYVRSIGIKLDPIRASFRRLGVVATPTLLLVDQNGVVTARWQGRLTELDERRLLDSLSQGQIKGG